MSPSRSTKRVQRVGQIVLAGALLLGASPRDRRVVDTVLVGDAASEGSHGFDGVDVQAGHRGGSTFRTTSGWMHFTLRTYDDTDVTLLLTFVRPDSVGRFSRRRVDVLVENTVVASPTVHMDSLPADPFPIAVPFALTKGKGHIAVVLRAHDGPTPALAVIRTMQEHYEQLSLQTSTFR
ncbi:MAG: hypothetical protein IT353_01255 [Gemmatimonadaceae bacterium]|nr:hypothetical protein [Gemmatimonadaceae bacterium]